MVCREWLGAWAKELLHRPRAVSEVETLAMMTIVDTIELYTKKLYLFMCMGALFACMSVCCACLVPWEARKGVESPETGVADRCKMPCRCWELNPASLEEKPVVLITGPAFQPANYTLLKWSYIL